MAKSKRKAKLKVYRTPVGFHDAYVAAPSQKAALEAWGVETNLFARDAAEQVTEPELTKVPLEHPGEVVRVLRGTRAEQLAALDKFEGPRPASRESRLARAEVVTRKPKKRAPKLNRAALDKAEERLKALEKRQSGQLAKIDKEIEALDQRRREVQRRHEAERDKAVEKVESEREKYEDALARSG